MGTGEAAPQEDSLAPLFPTLEPQAHRHVLALLRAEPAHPQASLVAAPSCAHAFGSALDVLVPAFPHSFVCGLPQRAPAHAA